MMRKRRSSQIDDENLESSESTISSSNDVSKCGIHSIPSSYAIYFFIYIVVLYFIVHLIDSRLPVALTVPDEETSNPNDFISERAIADLKTLTSIGPRVVGGYENEVLAVNFLQHEIKQIQNQCDKNNRIDVNLQNASGSYYLDFKPDGCINAYGNVQNIVVKFTDPTRAGKSAILINAHYDSVPTSLGGSDDGIMVAVMLEVLRKLSKSSQNFKHDVIFLFNGAEESVLQASHAFITQHEWRKFVRVVINLEAAGAGSKEILFQTGPEHPWLLKYYMQVPHPHGQVTGEEIFQSNIIPSDTDFRVFRDYGNLYGYDFAFYRNGYRYHTKYDDFINIPSGSYQHVGDNILHLVRQLANSSEIEGDGSAKHDKAVYYDFIGLFMISYDTKTMFLFNMIVCMLSIFVACKAFLHFKSGLSGYRYVLYSLMAIIFGWALAVITVFVISLILDALHASMSWYGKPWLIFGLYFAPAFAKTSFPLIVLNYFYKDSFSLAVQSQVQSHLIRVIFTGVLFVGTLLGIRATYAIMIPILFNAISCCFVNTFKLQYGVSGWRITHVVFNIIPTMFLMYTSIILFDLLIPILGRSGSNKNPDLIIGMLCCMFTILIGSIYVNLLVLVRNAQRLLLVLFGIFLIYFLLAFRGYNYTYSADNNFPRPQRFMIYHTNRKFHDENGMLIKEDRGFFLINMDRNSPRSVRKYVDEFKKAVDVTKDCETYLYCGFPLQHSRMVQVMKQSTWIPTEESAIITEPVGLVLNSKQLIANRVVRFNLTASGPDHMSVFFALKENVKLLNISLVTGKDRHFKPHIWKNREVVFIHYSYGKIKTPLSFSFDVQTSKPLNAPMANIVISGQYLHHNGNQNTNGFINFLKKFPDWADIIPALANYESFIY